MAANHKTGRDHTAINIRDDRKKCKKCIFRVPNVLRRQNPEAYTPDVVSIGPFHHCPETRAKEKGKGVKEGLREKDFQLIKQVKQTYLNEILAGMNITTLEGLTAEVKEGLREKDFQLIEQVKQTYLNEILAGMNITTLEGLTAEVIKLSDQKSEGGFEQRAREFYAESFNHIPSKDFTEMMIVDGCFLLQLFRKFNHPNLRAFDDLVFNMDCMFHFLCHDILLLENQLPWFVIHSLYNLTDKLYPSKDSLSTLILEAFSILPSLKQSCSSYKNHLHKDKLHCEGGFLHILDLLRSSIVIPLRTIEERELKAAGKEGISNGPAEEHQVRCESSKDKRDDKDVHGAIFDPDLHQIRTATDLSKADIKFESVTRESIMVIQFEKGRFCRNGVLKIPKLNIGMSSETLFRNFIAIEQCYHDYRNEITSYAILMDNLISSQDDMELLCKKKVIGNWMSDEDGCKFFSNLYKDIPHNKFYYVRLCKQVNDCYSSKWYTWLALLKSEKFSNPWRILAFGIGIFILILTAWSQSNNIRVNMHKW